MDIFLKISAKTSSPRLVVESAEFMLNKSGCHSIVEGILINSYTDPFIIIKGAVSVIFFVYFIRLTYYPITQ